MSMDICKRCGKFLDVKNEGLDGIYGDTFPHEYICPDCVDVLATAMGVDDVKYQDQRIIEEFRYGRA